MRTTTYDFLTLEYSNEAREITAAYLLDVALLKWPLVKIVKSGKNIALLITQFDHTSSQFDYPKSDSKQIYSLRISPKEWRLHVTNYPDFMCDKN